MRAIVTGGSGFIGSNIIKSLNLAGVKDIIIVDNINISKKWKNLVDLKYSHYYHKDIFLEMLKNKLVPKVDFLIHMGACSETTQEDFDYLYNNNFVYSKLIWDYCIDYKVKLIYASSASVYGDGNKGFNDKDSSDCFLPLNRYAYSKKIFDAFIENEVKKPEQYVGLRFFNVYGPNENHKGKMASMIYHGYNQISRDGMISLFKSYKKDIADGEQKRDFIYVKDVCKIVNFFVFDTKLSGIFNIGTSYPRSFNDIAKIIFSNLKRDTNIKYIEMPNELKDKYQYLTKADISKLRDVGYTKEFYTLEEGINDYIDYYLKNE